MNRHIAFALFSFVFLMGCSGTIPKLGVNSGQLLPCPDKPNCVSTQATDKIHFIEPIHFSGTAQEAQNRLLQILKTMEGAKIMATEENYVRVALTSKVLRFVDDAEFYFVATEKQKMMIHLRSASRIGHSDFGVNRERIEQIRHKFHSSNE